VVVADGGGEASTDEDADHAASTEEVGDDWATTVVGGPGASVGVAGPLGAQILLWQYATAIAARLSGGSPFGSPSPAEPARVMPDISTSTEDA